MSGKGGSAQDRRRARRAAVRVKPDLSGFEALASRVTLTAASPMKGQCANCDHMASSHSGPMNDGQCSVKGCSCDGMVAAANGEAAAKPMSGRCSDCGHMASSHAGPMNDGACSTKGCACDGMTASNAAAADAEELAIPASADYRPAENDSQSCGTCASYDDGTCSKWDASVDSGYTCDSWKAPAEAETASTKLFVLNNATGTSSSGTFQLNFPPSVVDEAADVLARGAVMSASEDAATSPDLLSAIKRRFETFLMEFDSIVADGGPVIPEEHAPGETLPAANPSPATPATPEVNRGHKWTAVFVPEATLTDDGRAMAPGSVKWRELPLSLMGLTETSAEGGHDGAIICGRIDNIWRDGYLIRASGVFDDSEYGMEIARMVGDKTLTGVSVDLAIHEYEVGSRSDYFDDEGNWKTEAALEEDEVEKEEPSLVDLLFGPEEDAIFVVTDAVIGMSTVCPFPAFADASIALEASMVAAASPAVLTVTQQAGWTVVRAKPVASVEAPVETITASAAGLAPVKPPAEWFDDPAFDELTPFTVDDDGRVYGHAWAWDTCHLAFQDRCTTAPASNTDYAYFMLKEVECEGGEKLAVGTITLDTGHAAQRASRADAAAHYDNTGTAVVDVRMGEDEFGGWVAGALRSNVDAEKARTLRGAVLSGDWRNVDGHLELVALLAVNVPGFPVPRAKALVAAGDGDGQVLALVAAGVHAGPREPDPEQDIRDIEALAALIDDAA